MESRRSKTSPGVKKARSSCFAFGSVDALDCSGTRHPPFKKDYIVSVAHSPTPADEKTIHSIAKKTPVARECTALPKCPNPGGDRDP
ncbi:hypothetical protein L248_1525 [Schleiferilactobacillus shenzhenensis LY-73]|uniref:Uncharacterized protein n=1 Tax=Schleiferilactobacillus shenzhenensis LY-73 TaxID=1231336 RepID=U4TIX7_9LACO|nr:hypothetical protein L248_1525 [Schleiferilactobacillus shenzhenensis LY-73]